ncbi:hypothetical protein L593_10575 [Salinarchaeum sp. Harcht-Bsk1]|uniref:toll/interleukin-1 receptor domain-containing protein n=1 Tax=Salinarchaeum sp. Harcht-Bsk1 TaxID=1333523 RepID=UPI00034230A3|nr:toll/interleukin-1 receptor domain-containing protein [Salinarchaeum sp. Harcht-Bsk1]AGN02060.1 hypothetical protein L593_10575 [Salinarchaeum sp. Harcht-Bsk1]
MAETRVFVSHATADLDVAQNLCSSIRNLPLTVALAGEEVQPGRVRRNLEGQLRNSDLAIALLTDEGAADYWVNQELGYAVAKGLPIIPIVEDDAYLRGYVEGTDGVQYDAENPEVTVFNLLSRVRSELEPIGTLSSPNWYVAFPCNNGQCRAEVQLEIDQLQKDLWQKYEHGKLLRAECPECGASYEFNPATLGFVRSVPPTAE